MDTDYIIVSRTESPELYNLLVEINKNDDIKKRIMAYAQKLTKIPQNQYLSWFYGILIYRIYLYCPIPIKEFLSGRVCIGISDFMEKDDF